MAVSSVGTQMNSDARRLFLAGYREMLDRLKPSTILFYGYVPEECAGDTIVPLMTFQEGLKKRVRAKEAEDGR